MDYISTRTINTFHRKASGILQQLKIILNEPDTLKQLELTIATNKEIEKLKLKYPQPYFLVDFDLLTHYLTKIKKTISESIANE